MNSIKNYYSSLKNKISILTPAKRHNIFDNMLKELAVITYVKDFKRDFEADLMEAIDEIAEIKIYNGKSMDLKIKVEYNESYRGSVYYYDYFYIGGEEVEGYCEDLEHLEGEKLEITAFLFNDLVDYLNNWMYKDIAERIYDYEQISTIEETQNRLKNMNKKKSARKVI